MPAQATSIEALAKLLIAKAASHRVIAGIAGAPGSGKSTAAEALSDAINVHAPGTAAVLPMDGYHFDDILLNQLGRRARKGAPDTFDVGGFRHMLLRLRENAEAEVLVPVFDRDIEIARAGARVIPQSVKVIIAEGNYLLLKTDPWATLRPLFDATVFIDVPEQTLRERLTARWIHYKLSPEGIRAKLEDNDLPNGRFVIAESVEPDWRIVQA